jgi:hypothetical protein
MPPLPHAPYLPQLRTVDSGGNLVLGPFQLAVSAGAGTTLGLWLADTEPWYQDENSGPFLNYQWAEIAYPIGYRYYVNLNFRGIDAANVASSTYGLALLDTLYQAAVQTQVTYAALQFSLFGAFGSPFFGVVPAGNGGFHPMKESGKQGFYSLSLSFKSRDLQQSPKPWAASQW